MEKNYEISRLLDLYGSLLNEKQRNTLVCYYEEDLSLSEIAQNEGISRQGVSDSIRRAEAQLKSFEEKLHLLAICGEIENLSNAAGSASGEIKNIIDKLAAMMP
ncbi:MAG: DNA-binding protein [Clostridia bacterium]|nr:DNA-binding protein [Clostridia bacterium]